MKMLKKLVSVALAGAMTLALSVSAFAATGISADEQRLIDAAKKIAAERGITDNAEYKKYLAQAEATLASGDVNLTATEVNALIGDLGSLEETAKEILKANNASSLEELKASNPTAYNSLVSKVESQAIAAANNEIKSVKISVNADGSIAVTPNDSSSSNSSQNTVVETKSVIKQTGTDIAADKVVPASVSTSAVDMTTTIVLSVLFVGAVAACGVVAKKKNLFSGVEA